MVALSPFLVLSLLATPHSSSRKARTKVSQRTKSTTSNQSTPQRRRDSASKSRSDSNNNSQQYDNHEVSNKRKGRKRYNRSGDKIKSYQMGDKNHDLQIQPDHIVNKQQEVNPLPSLTSDATPWSKRPTFFTCRHTYENTLINEIERFAHKEHSSGFFSEISGGDENHALDNGALLKAYSPYPGLVCVEDEANILPRLYDPVYALQTIPNASVVSGDSIKNIALAIYEALVGQDGSSSSNNHHGTSEISMLRQRFRSAPRGSLAIHALVPGMCKGQSKPIMLNRSEKIGEELSKMLRKIYPAARKKTPTESKNNQDVNEDNSSPGMKKINDDNTEAKLEDERWLLQFMLQSNTIAIASLTECQYVGPGRGAYWPNINHPLGLADVNIEEKMPSSAYRKLMEGIECMGIYPSVKSNVVDLGACPGGWTSAMRRLGSTVIAVDRSKLDKSLMNDDKVTFVQGDAFSFVPDWDEDKNKDRWMISDIIAYPERCTELVDSWCKHQLVDYMVVTMKFQGDEPILEELDNAIDAVHRHGYKCRVKHFFNNKNEVTMMIAKKTHRDAEHVFDVYTESSSIYRRIL